MYFGILLYDKKKKICGGEDGKKDEMPENAGGGGMGGLVWAGRRIWPSGKRPR